MKKWFVVVAVAMAIVVVAGVVVWTSYVDISRAVKHETSRWAVIEDVNRDRIAAEPLSNKTWSELVQLNQNGTRRLVGGIVE